ncbi:MAG: fumarylacetoacetate hydrolase family protein [Bryobacterales bacterium]|jgi:2-keto-4-pentenoate hydratase/2-oxohepta-3-ene-1,7-dioic acid hydratase in catechol pathway|nr:fumarylacetoacetate hydrolase family protein [Bryobacterales bacterium]
MRFAAFRQNGVNGLAARSENGTFRGLLSTDPQYPGELSELLVRGGSALADANTALLGGATVDLDAVDFRPPVERAGKFICVGHNYVDHALEGGHKPPTYPVLFARFASSLTGHLQPLVSPSVSTEFDYEGELVAFVGKGGRNITRENALEHIAGYSIFNDGSVRDYQYKTQQWTVGKNFDNTGGFGPWFVSADELPAGARGLKLETRLNGNVMQSASTVDMIFTIQDLVAIISEVMTLLPGDVLITGTPSGVGKARKPPVFMKAGDVCEIEIEGIGVLRNPVV